MLFVLVGSVLKVDLVWNLSDLFNGLMALPNLIALIALSGLVSRISRGRLSAADAERYPDDPRVQNLMQQK